MIIKSFEKMGEMLADSIPTPSKSKKNVHHKPSISTPSQTS